MTEELVIALHTRLITSGADKKIPTSQHTFLFDLSKQSESKHKMVVLVLHVDIMGLTPAQDLLSYPRDSFLRLC